MLTIEQIKSGVQSATIEFPIKRALLFGSYAEGTNTENSDVDLIVEFQTPAISLFTLAALKYRLQEELKTDVDIIHGPLVKGSILTVEKVVELYEQ